MSAKRYPLPKRFSVAVSEKAYKNLRDLNETYHYGNNYILTLLLENLDSIANSESLEKVFADFKKAYGAPARSNMKK